MHLTRDIVLWICLIASPFLVAGCGDAEQLDKLQAQVATLTAKVAELEGDVQTLTKSTVSISDQQIKHGEQGVELAGYIRDLYEQQEVLRDSLGEQRAIRDIDKKFLNKIAAIVLDAPNLDPDN